jgi:hypothetical protein
LNSSKTPRFILLYSFATTTRRSNLCFAQTREGSLSFIDTKKGKTKPNGLVFPFLNADDNLDTTTGVVQKAVHTLTLIFFAI